MGGLNRTECARLVVSLGIVMVIGSTGVADVVPDERAARPGAPVRTDVPLSPNDRVYVPEGPLEVPVEAPPSGLRGEPLRRSAIAPIAYRRFTSVQVNVDGNGDDLFGDAANEPSIAVDPNDRAIVAIGWRQFDTVLSNFRQAGIGYSQDVGATWTFPGVLDPGQFRSDPVLSSDADGNFYYSSLSAVDSAEVFKSTDGGVTWSGPVPAFGGDKQWLVVDATANASSGSIYQNWNVQFSCCGSADFTRSLNGGAAFQGPFAIATPSMKWGTLNVGPEGELYSAGSTLNQAGHLIARSDNASVGFSPTFSTPVSVNLGGTTAIGQTPNPQGLMGQVWVATDHSNGPTRGNVYIVAGVNPPGSDPLDVHFVRSEDGGQTFSAPVRINDDSLSTFAYQWMATMSVAPNGRIDVVWLDTRIDPTPANPTLSELRYSHSLDAGETWSPSEVMSPSFNHSLGYPQQAKMGDYFHMISFDDEVYLAWCATFTGGQDIYFTRFSPFCEPSGCLVAIEPAPEVNTVAKNRYLSIVPGNAAGMTALRVTLTDLPVPYESSEGLARWVGEPQLLEESATQPEPPFKAAPLVCDPVFRDWGVEGTIHVYSDAIIPNASYAVQAIFDDCDLSRGCDYSPALSVETARWGDVAAPYFDPESPTSQPNFGDITAIVSKFKDDPGAIRKVFADLSPNSPDAVVNFKDISDDVEAFKGNAYPYPGPSACP